MDKYIEKFIVPDPELRLLPVTETSWPLNMACHQEDPIILEDYGYVEEEYLVSGLANVYAWEGTTGNPKIKSSGCPYCTRIIVRKPANASKFSGNVLVEMMHNSGEIDNPCAGWATSFEHILSSGDGYVGISVSGATFKALKNFDSKRYADLSFQNPIPPELRRPVGNMASSPDQIEKIRGGAQTDAPEREKGLDFDMVSQVGAMLKRGNPGTPFAGHGAKHTYLIGVTFGEIPCYASAILPFAMVKGDQPVYDGLIIYMSGRAGNLNREEGALPWDDPRCICGGIVPIVRIQTSGELRGVDPHPLWACMYRSENSDEPGKLGRWYEVAGASLKFSARRGVSAYPSENEIKKAGVEEVNKRNNALRSTNIPGLNVSVMQHIITCTYRNLKDWSISRIPLPEAPVIEMTGGYPDGEPVLDVNGNQIGGVRSHYVDVPIAAYYEDGTITPFSIEKLTELYGSRENWLAKVKERLDIMVNERWILPEGARMLLHEAEETPWP